MPTQSFEDTPHLVLCLVFFAMTALFIAMRAYPGPQSMFAPAHEVLGLLR